MSPPGTSRTCCRDLELSSSWVSSGRPLNSSPPWDRRGQSPGKQCFWENSLGCSCLWHLCCVRAGPEVTPRLLLVGQGEDKRERPPAVPGEGRVGYWEQFLPGKGCAALAQLPRAGGESPSLQGFKSPVEVALGDTGEGWPGQGWGSSWARWTLRVFPTQIIGGGNGSSLLVGKGHCWCVEDPLAHPGVVRPGLGGLWAGLQGSGRGVPAPGSQEFAAHPPNVHPVRAGAVLQVGHFKIHPPPSPSPSRDTALPLSPGVDAVPVPWQSPDGSPRVPAPGVQVLQWVWSPVCSMLLLKYLLCLNQTKKLLKISKE
ncbi:uncharacterized protein LOC127463866 [Manacus candei]|uniref:uncharacterized protein LOC127463866 n=1 Tax=Manacus candei TaxID=415023 RepID=UPI002225CB76|nr:uncharacterized protein LOC127463866 [Manacus candei]XP_051629789.1 uncharacterized protein LOC127463866 [Manacus candei]XP_051629790.1 uncharacterized protein LOC127463866 [Manacus candei]XP_051629791.1 uncharacterized protein LOC127463866 [Manacus candei]XP_051629793.1 uncharacterized protein LOC127463866 [Manacus candei]XP_051629794.1 uncharacterized protein LOC127463866 [Manacus candei]XP_051629795.1 uncharacterized protein LOC127463866 [Manacus candei]XP_051629796.1 uncharacterized p